MANYSKTEVKTCNGFLFNVLYFGIRVLFFFKGIKISITNKAGQVEGPAIVLCSHGSFYDFLYAGGLLKKSKPSFIIARLYFYNKYLGFLLKALGGFPKSMFATDLESTKNCLKVLKSGGVLTMMPEARLSTAGEFEDIQEGTFSFLKKSAVPVYTIHIDGNYLAKPKWGKGLRKGALVEATLDILYTADQLRQLSVEEIKKGVEERLYYNSFEWLENRPEVTYRSKYLAEGLENILCFCPECGRLHTLKSKGNQIFCEYCGYLTAVDNRYGFDKGFAYKDHLSWHKADCLRFEEEIKKGGFKLEAKVDLRLPSSDGKSQTRPAGSGICTLTEKGLEYKGTKDGAEYEQLFPLERIYRLLFGAGENFETYNGSEILYFVPEDKRTCVDWYIASRILYSLQLSYK